MPVNVVAENVFGYLGAFCWAIQLVPQIWKSRRTKDTNGLSQWLVLLWALSAPFLGVYVIVQNLNVPLILQPQLFCTFALVSWGQCQYYGKNRSKLVSIVLTVSVAAILGCFEVGMVFALKSSNHEGQVNQRGLQFFGIVCSVIISLALFPQYYEIWRLGEVRGISITFMIVDLLGGVFSDLSLIFKADFDTIAAITYTLVVPTDAEGGLLSWYLLGKNLR
ncbi:hypothetical protein PILCRDRAFT_84557 [Piloderma croceum F 1598]|uniref:PQ-loop-domain-containing protein n=1 Tax=Piloderma croceum (strain F 1598) TaxID=765440 RepID=A0A0C3G2Z6_PILCF|nr:hypothetical protein PILCRDRAFT_84557 [Piloderma croceum F 1598]